MVSKEVMNMCRKEGFCINFQKGNCPWTKCRFKHEIATQEPKPAEDTKDTKAIEVGMIQVNMADSSGKKNRFWLTRF